MRFNPETGEFSPISLCSYHLTSHNQGCGEGGGGGGVIEPTSEDSSQVPPRPFWMWLAVGAVVVGGLVVTTYVSYLMLIKLMISFLT